MPSPNAIPLWGQWISHIRQTIKQRAAVKLSTEALMSDLEELGNWGGFAGGTPSNPAAFASINELIPSVDVDKLLHSSQLLKRARIHTFQHTNHYMEFFTAVEQVVEHASKPPPRELQRFMQKYRQQKLLLEAIEQNNIVCVADLISHAHPTSNNSLALRKAATHGHSACVAHLIGVSDFKPYDQSVASALELAAKHGHDECVILLMPHEHPSIHTSACQEAARNAHCAIVRNLLPRVERENLKAVLASAAWGGNVEVVKMVEQQFGSAGGADALASASIAGQVSCVEYLVEKATQQEIVKALEDLSKWPDRYGVSWDKVPPHLLEWTPNQKQCAHILIMRCNAQKLLDVLQAEYPNKPLNWRALEEQLCVSQRLVLEHVVEYPQRTRARRKM